MSLKLKTFHQESDLAAHIKTHAPSFYFSSRTSTVIPFDKLEADLGARGEFFLCDLSKIPGTMELLPNNNLKVRGAVNWQDADRFLKSKGRAIMTSPTEQLALITGGVATSCTGERCFAFGNMRQQVARLKYLDHNGVEHELKRSKKFSTNIASWERYCDEFRAFDSYKNAPYPRFEIETDLMIGTEGQLGVVTEVEIETAEDFSVNHVFLLLPRWEEDLQPHMEIYQAVQKWRSDIISVELLDSNCMAYLKPDERLGVNQDIIFLEIKAASFEKVYAELLAKLRFTTEENVFEITAAKFHSVRAGVPRGVFEENSKMGVKKMGTDCQVGPAHFEDLMNFYRHAARLGVRYNLFGHFGDAHLHYNYMPRPEDTARCQGVFQELYDKVLEWHGSPFAEHGIGLLKRPYIKAFHGPTQLEFFAEMKKIHDPFGQFFPQGFMGSGAR